MDSIITVSRAVPAAKVNQEPPAAPVTDVAGSDGRGHAAASITVPSGKKEVSVKAAVPASEAVAASSRRVTAPVTAAAAPVRAPSRAAAPLRMPATSYNTASVSVMAVAPLLKVAASSGALVPSAAAPHHAAAPSSAGQAAPVQPSAPAPSKPPASFSKASAGDKPSDEQHTTPPLTKPFSQAVGIVSSKPHVQSQAPVVGTKPAPAKAVSRNQGATQGAAGPSQGSAVGYKHVSCNTSGCAYAVGTRSM